MKKQIFHGLLISALIVLIFSCSKSDIKGTTGSRELSKNEKMILKNPEIETELIMLMEFNESLLKERGAKTRGWFGRLASTVSADALAAYGGFKASVGAAAFITAATGGTAGPAAGVAVLGSTAFIAGGASYGAHQALRSRATSANLPAFTMKSTDIQNILNSNNISNQPDINSLIYHSDSYNYIGYLHNQYLEMLLTDWSKTRSSNNKTNLSENSFFSKEQLDEMYNRVMIHINEYLSSGYDYDKCIAKFSENDLSTKKTEDVFRLYLDMLFQFTINSDDLVRVSQTYIDVIKNSEKLSIEDKNILLISFDTAINSMQLWEEKGLQI